MERRINEKKADALLKWVNTANITSKVNSLQELSNTKLLVEIVYLIDKEYQVAGLNSLDDNGKSLMKVLEYLENFYHQPLADFVDHKKIIDAHNSLEIGKVLSLLLCCAVQGENVSECIDKITSMEENLQFQLKSIIEAVLKDLDNGRIDSMNVTDVLCQSESFRNVQALSEEYQSLPIVMSPVSMYNSPIKALMASPQMQSRQSQVTISKLYKSLNQFQIKINNLQRARSELDNEIEEKRKLVERQETQIQSLSKEATKVPALQEEVESLTRFEAELEDANRECDRLRKSTQQLMMYKEQFLKLEKDCSDLAAEKEREKLEFQKFLKEMKNENKEELQSVQSMLNESNKTCDDLRMRLQQTSMAEITMRQQLREQQDLYAKEIEKLKKTLAEAKVSRDKLCLKNDQDVLRQIAREAELKECFRDQKAALQTSTDQLQLQNCELKRNMHELQMNFIREEEAKKILESSLADSQAKLTEVVGKYEHLQTDFVTLGSENKITIDKILEEKDAINKALKEAQARRDLEIAQERKINEELEEKSRCLVSELDEARQKLFETKQDQESLQTIIDGYSQGKKLLLEENELLSKKLSKVKRLEVPQIHDSSDDNSVLLKESALLRNKVKQQEPLPTNFEALQNLLNQANEEKMFAINKSASMKEQLHELELSSTELQKYTEDAKEQIQSLKEENLLLKKQAQQANGFSEELNDLRNSRLRISIEERKLLDEISKLGTLSKEYMGQRGFDALNEEKSLLKKENTDLKLQVMCALEETNKEKVLLEEQNTSLKDEVIKLGTIAEEHKTLQNHFGEEKLLLMKENADLVEKVKLIESLSSECADLRQSMETINEEKVLLEETNSSLKDEIAKLEIFLSECKVFQDRSDALTEEKFVLNRENADLKERMKETKSLSSECAHLRQLLETVNKDNVSLVEEIGLLKAKLEHSKDSAKHSTPSQSEKEASVTTDKYIQSIAPLKHLVNNHDMETKLQENGLIMSKLDEIVRKFKVACKQEKQVSATQQDNIAKIEADLRQCYANVVNDYTEYKKKVTDQEKCLEVDSKADMGRPMVKLDGPSEKSTNEEINFRIQQLQNKLTWLEKENENLKTYQEKSREEFLTERAQSVQMKKDFEVCEDAMKKLNDNNVELELEMLTVRDQMKSLEGEKAKLENYVPQVEAKVVDLEKKLAEEEFISKRLAVEVRSLEAQLSYADRQLRQKLDSEDSQEEPCEKYENPSMEIKARMSPVTEDSVVTAMTDDSIVSEDVLPSKNEDVCYKKPEELANNNTNMSSEQEDVVKRLRRRSAVYSKKNSQRPEINDKRRSTVGTESFVVGQFSSTVAEEPEEHSYDWDRILELKKRNSVCLPHMRSSYPVEIQVRLKEEVEEEELKSGCSTRSHTRKRLHVNVSDSSIFTSFDADSSRLPRSKSEDAFGKRLTERMTEKLNSLKKNDENENFLSSSTSCPERTIENGASNEQYNRRESIAFKVDITPVKKPRMSLRPRLSRSFAKPDVKTTEPKETPVKNKSKVKHPPNSKKFTLQRKPSSVRSGKKPLKQKCSNYAI